MCAATCVISATVAVAHMRDKIAEVSTPVLLPAIAIVCSHYDAVVAQCVDIPAQPRLSPVVMTW